MLKNKTDPNLQNKVTSRRMMMMMMMIVDNTDDKHYRYDDAD
jgi:hypothetical protein